MDLRTELLRRGFSGEEAEAYLDAGAPLRLTVWCALLPVLRLRRAHRYDVALVRRSGHKHVLLGGRYGGRTDCAAVADVALVVDTGEVVLPNYTGERLCALLNGRSRLRICSVVV